MGSRCGYFTLLLLAVSLCLFGTALSAEPLQVIHEVDQEGGSGAPFPPEAGFRLGLRPDGRASLAWAKGSQALSDPTQVTFDQDDWGVRRVFTLDPLTGELLVLRPSAGGLASQVRRLGELAGIGSGGLAVDGAGDRLFVLDAARGRILSVEGFLRGGRRRVDEIALPANPPALRGLARHPLSGHLFALAPATGELLELAANGELVAVHQLPGHVREVSAIAIAASSDHTDDPARQSLFAATVTEGGGTTFELALEPLQLAAVTTEVPTLLQTILTSNFTPPSPDPSGIELLGPNGPLLICDGEVEEMSIYRGVNLWEVSLSGTQTSTADTTFFSDEPTGAAVNPANGHYFFSDDTGTQSVYEVTPGSDGRVNSGDPVRQIRVSNYGPVDCEGVAFGGGSLWIAAGSEAEVYRISPGPNGVFDSGGDDVVSHFDTGAPGLTDAEGIAYDSDGGNVYVAGPSQDTRIAHFTATGQLLRWLDTSGASPRNPAGLAYGPGPAGSTTRRLYMVTRGTDNGSDPNENDGKLLVYAVNPIGGGSPTNQPPVVSAGPDLVVDISAAASLDGTVSDDGLPGGGVTQSWSKISGPGTVGFGNANAIDTSATFSSVGTYVLRLTANDGQLSGSDETTITVTSSGGGGTTTFEKRVAASADDAEQSASGGVDLGSSDLELVNDGGDLQTVGLRFSGVAIPPGAGIVAAWIQFQADEVSPAGSSLTLQAEASDNAVPFTTGTNNVGARPRTGAAVGWTPPAWNTVGEAGAPQRTPDLSLVVQQVVSRGGWLSGNAMVFVITGSGSSVAESFDGTAAGAALLHVVFQGAAGNLAPVVSAGPDRSIPLGQAASLDGTVSDDGLPSGSSLTTTWSKVSGPGTVTFGNASAVDTTATFSASGSYILRLSAFDGERTSQDEMAVTVAGNVAPTVSAGPDRTITLGQAASLDGTVSDDGLPSGSVTQTWSKVSGPGTVTFGNASAVDTTATFSTFGSYVLRLSASDGQLGAQDEMAVGVLDPNAGGVVDRRIAVSSDDAEQRLSNAVVAIAGGDLNMAFDGPKPQLVGLRFPDLPIPAGATIQNAWIQFVTDELSTGGVSLTIQTEATANPATFTATANNVGARPRSGASVAWSPGDWILVHEAGGQQRTPSLVSVVQEAVRRAGWAPGNAIVFIVSGSGTRTAESFEGGASRAPLLHVEYGPGG